METLILPQTPFPFNRKLQKMNIIVSYSVYSLEYHEESEPYLTWGGVTIQDDVSILSVWATNKHCMWNM